MQVQPELPGEHFRVGAESIPDAALLEERYIQVRITAAEYLPAHFNVAIGRDPRGGRDALL